MITRRNYRPLCDFAAARQFMVEIYERDWRNGVPAPEFESALCFSNIDSPYSNRILLFEEDGRIVALVYMEPLCTVPEYRRRGLAAAALSELYRRLKPLGATHMTGGGDPFYAKIGFEPCVEWGYYERSKTGDE